jgi:hypothetical protein
MFPVADRAFDAVASFCSTSTTCERARRSATEPRPSESVEELCKQGISRQIYGLTYVGLLSSNNGGGT